MKTKILLGIIFGLICSYILLESLNALATHKPTNIWVEPSNPSLDSLYFHWDAISGAITYHIQVDNNSNFSSPEIDVSNISATSYNASNQLTSSGTYYVRLRWCNNNDPPCSEFTDQVPFFVSN